MVPGPAVIAIFGSSFPIWIFAALAGLVMSLILREILIITGVSRVLPMAGLFYLSISLIAGIGVNYLWIGGYG